MQNGSVAAILAALAALAAVAAGCLGNAESDGIANAGAGDAGSAPGAAESAGEDGDAAAGAVGASETTGDTPGALYLTADLRFSAEPPSSEARIALPTPVNSPMTSASPEWSGEFPWSANLSGASATLVFYVTTSAASVSANTLPIFATGPLEFPDFIITAQAGNASFELGAPGPDAIVLGDVVEVRVPLGALDAVSAGDAAFVDVIPTYSHVAGAAEFQFVLGPDAPARIEWAAKP